jgi:molecular chaperone DnaK (HSP70)
MSDESNGVLTPDSPDQYAIGISFGNSYSSIAHISGEGKVEVIANEEGDRQIPSILSYVEGEEYHGTQAKSQLVRNSKNTVAYFRDYLGKEYKSIDPTPCQASAHPQEVDGKVVFLVQDTDNKSPNNVSLSEVATRHLKRLKNSAADFSGKTVTSAVVAVPTNASEDQKAALTTALLAYDSRSTKPAGDKLALVADFGGNRSDVAVVASRGGMYSILATAHDYELGGTQLDQVLMDHFAKEFEKKHKSDPRKNERSLAKLKLESESVRKALSQSATATFSVESLADGVDFRSTVNRTRYELLAGKVFARFNRLVEEVLKKADLDVLDIDEVIMSGGASHTPRIATNIQGLFPESTEVFAPATSTASLNPSELTARGAALQASLVQEFEKDDIDQSTHEMITVTPHLTSAIGLQVTGQPGEAFTVVIPPATAVPARRTVTVGAPAGDVLVRICEGERQIKVTKPEHKPKENGGKRNNDDDDEDSDDEEDDEEDTRERIWTARKKLAEVALKDNKKGGKVEVTIHVDGDLVVNVTARPVGGKGGVRGTLAKPEVVENGHV